MQRRSFIRGVAGLVGGATAAKAAEKIIEPAKEKLFPMATDAVVPGDKAGPVILMTRNQWRVFRGLDPVPSADGSEFYLYPYQI